MRRRDMLRSTAIGIGSAFVCNPLTDIAFGMSKGREKHTAGKPNIVFFLIDDQRNDTLSCAGHPVVKTPTVDSLAADGVRFTNTFVTTSICAASRASIFTGLHESGHGYTFGKPPIAKEIMSRSYPYLLKHAGYTTGFVGKFGVQIEDQDTMIPEMFDYFKPAEKNAPGFVALPDGGRRHSAEVKGDDAVAFINSLSGDKPFCLSISFNAVHAVDADKTPGNEGHYPYPKAAGHLYENVDMPEPDLSDPAIFDRHPAFMKNSLNRERWFWRWDTEEKYETNLRAYFRMISGYDNVMKRVLNALMEQGLDGNTVIIYSADNGYYMGNRGFAGKWSHYEESLRVPLIIRDPCAPVHKRGKTTDNMALNIDIPATILDLAGVDPPPEYQGGSLVPVLDDTDYKPWRESFFCEHRMEHEKIPKYIGIRGKRYVYANYYEQKPRFEYLHDLEKDPDQLTNFADHPAYHDILLDMRRECAEREMALKRP